MARDVVDVWYQLTERLSEDDITGSTRIIAAAERQRAERFRFSTDRRDYVAAHAMLRGALSLTEDVAPSSWQFAATTDGKPFLAGDPQRFFNLSHTRGLVACAITRAGETGIDAEAIDRAVEADDVSRRHFSTPELQALEQLKGASRQTRFIELWTLKEAYLKAVGTGLGEPLDRCRFDLGGDGAIGFELPESAGRNCHFALFAPAPRYRIAVAVSSASDLEVRARQWPPDDESSLVPLRTA